MADKDEPEDLGPPDSPRQVVKSALDATSEVVGAFAGLGGTALFGPLGLLAGPAATQTFRVLVRVLRVEDLFVKVGKDFKEQRLSPAQTARVGTAFDVALVDLAARVGGGAKIRADGFFAESDDQEAPAETALIAVLTAARDASEERKAERLGALYAWIAVHPDITASHAQALIALASRLTYRQLLLLGYFADEGVRASLPDWTSTGAFTLAEMNLVSMLEGLAREGLVQRTDHRPIASFTDINPRMLRTVLNGSLLVEAMGLTIAEEEDFEELVELFGRLGKIVVPEGQTETREQLDMVVPPGSDPSVQRVQINHQVVQKAVPAALGLADVAVAEDEKS